MKWIGDIVGVILALMGSFWILQGTGLVPIGFMARQNQWVVIGLAVVLIGVALLFFVNRRPGRTRDSRDRSHEPKTR